MTGRDVSWVRVSRSAPCRICQHVDWCTRTTDGQRACCMRVWSPKELRNGGWLHDDDELPIEYATTHRGGPAASLAPIENRHLVYRALANMLGLSASHRQDLKNERGLPDEAIVAGFASVQAMDPKDRRDLSERVWLDAGGRRDVIHGVPGFYETGKGWSMAHAFSGILIPVPDRYGRIQACQVRATRPTGDQPRYKWLSSKFSRGGASSGAPVAIWRPELAARDRRVWITEGSLKSCIAAYHLPATVAAVAGVSGWRTVPDLLRELVSDGAEVVVAYDADATTNETVHHHRDMLALALDQASYTVLLAQWDGTRGKGIDDLLLAGGTPDVRSWQRTLTRLARPRGRPLPPLVRPVGIPLPPLGRPRSTPLVVVSS